MQATVNVGGGGGGGGGAVGLPQPAIPTASAAVVNSRIAAAHDIRWLIDDP
jgi:hypothetical protein